MRPTWDETWMQVALAMATRGDCEKACIGAAVVDRSNRIIATGYNGPPAGSEKTCRTDCPRFLGQDTGTDYGGCLTIHAEANALLFVDRRLSEGGTIYVTASMCMDCAKLVANSGLKRAVFNVWPNDRHRNPLGVTNYLLDCGLDVTTYGH